MSCAFDAASFPPPHPFRVRLAASDGPPQKMSVVELLSFFSRTYLDKSGRFVPSKWPWMASSCVSRVELDRQPRAALDLPGGRAADLAHEALDQREAGAGLAVLRHPPTVVPEPQAGLARPGPPELQADGAGIAPEGVLEAVRHELVRDQAERHRLVHRYHQALDLGPQTYPGCLLGMEPEQGRAEFPEVRAEV